MVQLRPQFGEPTAYPDTLVGTDSHTTMINGLGVLGWGVGGIEAEAVMLGQPYFMLIPEVIGMKLVGELPAGHHRHRPGADGDPDAPEEGRGRQVRRVLRPGPVSALGLADRATIANMAPEYGATMGFFPVDAETRALPGAHRPRPRRVRAGRALRQGAGPLPHRRHARPEFTATLELDLCTVTPSLAGPKRPQDLVPLTQLKRNFIVNLPAS